MPAAFLNPLMLAAMAAVLIPLIIELLHRRRRRILHFPAMRYLLKSAQQKKVRLQDLILLVLRSVVVFVLVLALARPFLKAGSALWSGGRRDVVLVFDATYSAGQRAGATTAFEIGKKMADQVIRSVVRDPRVSVLTLGHRAELVAERSRDLAELRAQVESLRVSDGSARIGQVLELAADFLERQGIRAAELYVISDLQKTTWSKRPGESQDPAALLSRLAGKCRLFVLDTGGGERANCCLARFDPRERVAAVGVENVFDVRAEAAGTPPPEGPLRVSFYVDGQKRGEKQISLASGSAQVAFAHTFLESGERVLKAVVEGDSLPADNARYYLCRVPAAVRVLIFDEAAGQPAAESQSVHLQRAIAPRPWPGFDRFTVFETQVRAPAEAAREDLPAYAVVVLAGVRNLTAPFAARLDQYVREGGRLLIFPGEGLEPYAYNSALYQDGKGILPAEVEAPAAPAAPGKGAFLSLAPPLHPALAHFKGRERLEGGEVLRCLPVKANGAREGAARTVARLTDGRPAIIERRVGRGRTMMVCTAVDGRWSLLPFSRDFPVLMQELLRYLVGDPDGAVNLPVGGCFEQTVLLSAQHLVVAGPDGRKFRVTPVRSGDTQEWRLVFDQTDRQGLYRVDAIPEAMDRRQFAVNLVPEESDLARFDHGEFKARFGAGGLEILDSPAQVRKVSDELHSRKELSTGLLWTLLALLFIETYLAKRFGLRRV